MLYLIHLKKILSLEFLSLDIYPSIQHGIEFAMIPSIKTQFKCNMISLNHVIKSDYTKKIYSLFSPINMILLQKY